MYCLLTYSNLKSSVPLYLQQWSSDVFMNIVISDIKFLSFTISEPINKKGKFSCKLQNEDRLCGLVVRVLGYRSGGPGSIPGTTKKK
jgi:hypothetical protein